ncbi:hypothetical protein G7Y89_g2996 [Cudoniella acicularis]|uniref:Rhodopsin domain-containing protein n=1 Tax=Cudoniella acicularis TaxID=354080 RepID=A0A8H4RU29_9HELO|nr:hypothetical protein G7Y89_g2996 [Cudoniella acicularis]
MADPNSDIQVNELGEYRSRATFCVVIVFTVTSTISVALRLAAKRINRTNLTLEDFTIFVAQASPNISLMILSSLRQLLLMKNLGQHLTDIGVWNGNMCNVGYVGSAGHHADLIPASHITEFLKILVAMQTFYATTLGLIKTSICLFYVRIFSIQKFRKAAWVVIGFIAAWSTMVFLTAFLLCTPLAMNWDPFTPGGHCANQTVAFIVIGVLDLIIDVAVFVLPLPMIYGLKVSNGKKVALFGIFGLGISTMILSILRIDALVKVSFADITYTAAYPLLWSFLEPAIGISVACGPLLGPLLKKSSVVKSITSRSKRTDYGNSNNSATFERLNDMNHELSSFKPNVTTVSVAKDKTVGPGGRGSFLPVGERIIGSADSALDNGSKESQTGIIVKREWETQLV